MCSVRPPVTHTSFTAFLDKLIEAGCASSSLASRRAGCKYFFFSSIVLDYSFGLPDERVRSFLLWFSSFGLLFRFIPLVHPTSGYDHLILCFILLVYCFGLPDERVQPFLLLLLEGLIEVTSNKPLHPILGLGFVIRQIMRIPPSSFALIQYALFLSLSRSFCLELSEILHHIKHQPFGRF